MKGTADAIFSDRLWDGVGLKSVSGVPGYWDRSTLYAFRGLAFCGMADAVLPQMWKRAALRNVRAHGAAFDLEVTRQNGKICVRMMEGHPARCILERELDEGGALECRAFL